MRRRSDWVAGLVAAGIALLVTGSFAWLGIVNGDEGWYALAAQSVGHGRIPYRDFAFTQGPVYPYLLAPIVRIWPSLTTTRAASVIMTAAAVGLLVTVAARIGRRRAALVAGLALAATIPALPYWLSITKTYALCFLLLAGMVALLNLDVRPGIAYPVVAALAVVLVATRTTGIAIAGPLVVALLVLGPDAATRIRVAVAASVTAAPFLALAVIEWPSVRWGLYQYHQLSLQPHQDAGRFASRTIAAVRAWPGPAFLAAATLIVVLIDPATRGLLRRRLDITAFAVGIPLFVLFHEIGSMFFAEEYLTPVIGIVVVACSVLLLRIARRRDAGRRSGARAIRIVLAVGIVLTAVTGGHTDYLGRPSWSGSVAGLAPVVRCVRAHSRPTDTVLALYLGEVVLQSGRRPVPGVSLGAFSYEDVPTGRARQLKVLNAETLVDTFVHRPPQVLVLTLFDFDALSRAGWFSRHRIDRRALNQQFLAYRPVCTTWVTRNVFKNLRMKVGVYVRRAPTPATPTG